MLCILYYLLIISSILITLSLPGVCHPLTFALSLIGYALILSFLSFLWAHSWWFYLLILIFLGGVMVLIIYMTTLSANETFSPLIFSFSYGLPLLLIPLMSASCPLPLNPSVLSPRTSFTTVLYEPVNLSMFIFCLVYLLFTMIGVVKIIKFDKGPLSARL